MNTNEQRAQRDKLIELAENWVNACCGPATAQEYLNAAKAFRDYVEHMHDEVKANEKN